MRACIELIAILSLALARKVFLAVRFRQVVENKYLNFN